MRVKPRGMCMEVFAAYNFPTPTCRAYGIMKAQMRLQQNRAHLLIHFLLSALLLLDAECQKQCGTSSSRRSSLSVKARAALSNSDLAWTVGGAKRGEHVANRASRASLVDLGLTISDLFTGSYLSIIALPNGGVMRGLASAVRQWQKQRQWTRAAVSQSAASSGGRKGRQRWAGRGRSDGA